jgi:curli production assembly/transport component CsgF
MTDKILSALVAATVLGAGLNAYADEMVYTPVNPSFGGNPFNSSHLLDTANVQNDHQAPTRESQSDQFMRMLQARLLSAIAGQISDSILGDDALPTGEISYGPQTVSWETVLDSIHITVTDSATGSITEIVIPSSPPIG